MIPFCWPDGRSADTTRALSMDLRERAMARLEKGETCRQVAAALQVGVSSVVKWSQRKRETRNCAPKKPPGPNPYSPDLNLIEQVGLRQAQTPAPQGSGTYERARLGPDRSVSQTFSPEACANYVANSGYRFNENGSRSSRNRSPSDRFCWQFHAEWFKPFRAPAVEDPTT